MAIFSLNKSAGSGSWSSVVMNHVRYYRWVRGQGLFWYRWTVQLVVARAWRYAASIPSDHPTVWPGEIKKSQKLEAQFWTYFFRITFCEMNPTFKELYNSWYTSLNDIIGVRLGDFMYDHID